MFILRNRVRGFIGDLRSEGLFSESELSELEDHLLEEAESRAVHGRDDESAFADAARRLGTVEELVQEFRSEHMLSRRLHPGWFARLDQAVYRLTRLFQAALLLFLPWIGLVFPVLVLGASFENLYAEMLPGLPLSRLTQTIFGTVRIIREHLWLLPVGLAVMVYPTFRTALRLHASGEFSWGSLFTQEYIMINRLWPWALVLYPVGGVPFVIGVCTPLIKLLRALGG